ncbi:hypothetical protein BJY00DRAFT_314676 [Aspergillus carlsbadensis]|nr:hypothetical protein BJY00DRAFT_314676 [Aspergillus carlsbadensis]
MLAWLLENNGDLEQAERMIADDVVKCEELFGDDDLDTLIAYNAYAVLFLVKGDLPRAEDFSRKSAEGRERRLGPAHPRTLNALTNLSMILAPQAHKYNEWLDLARKVLDFREQELGGYHIATLVSAINLMQILGRMDSRHRASNESEIRQLRGRLERALERGVWGVSMLDNAVRPTTLAGGSDIIRASTTSRLGFMGWIREQLAGPQP